MYLITGCAGFIGFHMCELLLKKNYKVIGIDNLNSYYSSNYKKHRVSLLKKNKNFIFYKYDLTQKKKIQKLFLKHSFSNIIHFAAQPGVIYSYKNPKSYYRNNVYATNILVDQIKKNKINHFIFSSSSSVYGDHRKYPINENFKFKPKNYYAKTKITCEKLIRKKLKKTETSVKIIRPFTVYGPYGRPDMLILKLLSLIKRNKTIKIYDHGNQMRDFTFVKDVINIIFLLSKKIDPNLKIFNICASQPIKINDIILLVQKNIRKKIKLKYENRRKGEMKTTYGSNKNLSKYIKFKKFTKIKDGLDETIKWFEKFKNKNLLMKIK
tara:strand:- start:1978 stop:2949 length:972 start_codon:yes stop_codon:yes gene_type:complete